ncbi:MAG TPA: hypothetical protein VFS43_31600 [Polyangiaceae bacterium]|nr:hypothetical protein [Polyangiaceae bacterium]
MRTTPPALLVAAALAAAAAAGCAGGPVVAYVASPHDRYDHNRTRRIVYAPAPNVGAGPVGPLKVRKQDYAPQPGRPFNGTLVVDADAPPPPAPLDGLPDARLVPVFAGLVLPLDPSPPQGCAPPDCLSDRDDLVDYLATGPLAQAGVEPAAAAGNVDEARQRYAPVLDLLGRRDALAGGPERLEARLRGLDVTWADRVVDGRYPAAAFASVAAFRYGDFWFVLYRLAGQPAYTRLVAAPADGHHAFLKKKQP